MTHLIEHRLRAVLIAAVVLLTTAPAATAAPSLRTPQSDRLYLGRLAFETWQPIVLKTDRAGANVKVAPGYFNHLNRCGVPGGDMFDTTIYSGQWLRVRSDKTFAGRGSGWTWLDTDKLWRGVYRWTITGRFTSPRTARGRLTITGAIHDNGRPWIACPARTVSWATRRTEAAEGSDRNW